MVLLQLLSTTKTRANQRTLHRHLSEEFFYSPKSHFTAMDSDLSHGCDTTLNIRVESIPASITKARSARCWIVNLVVRGVRGVKPSYQRHLFLTSQRFTPDALLQLVRNLWCIQR